MNKKTENLADEKPFRVVVKIGTNLLTKENGELDTNFIKKIAIETYKLTREKVENLFVISGAVNFGRYLNKREIQRKGLENSNGKEDFRKKQYLASLSQTEIFHEFRKIFKKHELRVSDFLVTENILTRGKGQRATSNLIEEIFENNGIAVMNGNAQLSTMQLGKMTNDELSAHMANLIKAALLVNLTSVDGICDKDPHKHEDAKLLQFLRKGNYGEINDSGPSKKGNGGARTKLKAADIFNGPMYVADGRVKNVLTRIILKNENPGTVIR